MNRKIRLFGALVLAVCLVVTVAGTGFGSGVKSDISTVTAGDYKAPIGIGGEIFFDNEPSYPTAAHSQESTQSVGTSGTTNFGAELSSNVGEKVSSFVDEKFGDITGIGGDVSGIGEAVSNFIGSDAVGQFGDTISGFVEGFGQLGGGIGDIFGNIGSGSGGSIFDSLLGGGGNQNTTYPTASHTGGYIEPVVTKSPTKAATTPKMPDTKITTHGATVDYAVQTVPYAKPSGEIKTGDKGDGVKWLQWIFIYTHYGLRDDGITGVMDEDTVAVVKKLQQERGFEVNGIVDQKLIDAAEVLWYQYKNNAGTTVTVTGIPETTVAATVGNNDAGKSAIVLGVVIIALVWIVAIALIVFILIYRRRGNKKAKNGREMTALEKAVESGSGEFSSQPAAEAKPDEVKTMADAKPEVADAPAEVKPEAPAENSGISNLSDLFEEANNSGK